MVKHCYSPFFSYSQSYGEALLERFFFYSHPYGEALIEAFVLLSTPLC